MRLRQVRTNGPDWPDFDRTKTTKNEIVSSAKKIQKQLKMKSTHLQEKIHKQLKMKSSHLQKRFKNN